MTNRLPNQRRYYLQDVPLDEARGRYDGALAAVGALRLADSERVSVREALGRITASPVWARRSSPHYDAAAMDGIAVRSADTVGASEASPLPLLIPQEARWVDTGDPLPDGFDAVVMIEVVAQTGDSTKATVRAILSADIPSESGREDFVPVKLSPGADGEVEASPVFGKSNLIFTLANADGTVAVPAESGGLYAGEVVGVRLG